MTKRNRCCVCKKKISVVDVLSSTCKCGKTFCLNHRLPEKHTCTYDFFSEVNKEEEIAKLKCVAELPKI